MEFFSPEQISEWPSSCSSFFLKDFLWDKIGRMEHCVFCFELLGNFKSCGFQLSEFSSQACMDAEANCTAAQDTGSGVLPEGVHLRPSLSCFAEGSLLPRGLFLRSAVFAMSDAEPTAAGRSLTEDEMAEVKKEVLERLRRYLCDKIIAERHFDYLRSKKILSREDTEEISCRTSSRKKAGKLLDYLAEHPKGLDTLIESIKCEKTQNFLLEKITDAVLKAKNEKLESLKGSRCNNCMASICEQANNLSRSQSNDSNFFEKQRDRENTYLHPEEYSTAAFVSASSLCSMNLPITEVGNMENSVFSTLPGPGDPGAPPVPTELQSEQEEISTTSSDNPFLPLRSRSILP